MKKITPLLVALFATFTMANADETTGQAVFDSKCVACHSMKMSKDMNMSMLKAPPISKVSAKIKHSFDNNKTKFVAFIADYIENPSQEKAKCMPMAIKKFGLMPPIGKAMTKEERQAVSEWMFDNFDEKWESNCTTPDCKGMGGMKCAAGKCAGDKAKGDMKCGKGKCTADKKTEHKANTEKPSSMKCGTGKCSAEKPNTEMKCAPGKCGGK